jgi:hypothetical protein
MRNRHNHQVAEDGCSSFSPVFASPCFFAVLVSPEREGQLWSTHSLGFPAGSRRAHNSVWVCFTSPIVSLLNIEERVFCPTSQKGILQRIYARHSRESDLERRGRIGRPHLIWLTFTYLMPTRVYGPSFNALRPGAGIGNCERLHDKLPSIRRRLYYQYF